MDLTGLFFMPTIAILMLGSLLVGLIKHKWPPYVLTFFVITVTPFLWYFIDKLRKKPVPVEQELLLGGLVALLIPALITTDAWILASALLSFILSIVLVSYVLFRR